MWIITFIISIFIIIIIIVVVIIVIAVQNLRKRISHSCPIDLSHKTPKINPRAYSFQRTFVGLIFWSLGVATRSPIFLLF